MISEILDLASFGLYPVRLHYPIFSEEGVRCSCGSKGCTGVGKHPVGLEWGKSASQDPEIIEQQFGTADWNVGIILGLCNGIPADQAIIDIEDDSLEGRALADTLLRDFPCPTYTSGKSLHRLYRWNENLPPVANMTISGLEFRFGGKGKQTQSVAPPSMHSSGKRYQWLPGRSLTDLEIPEVPEHIVEYLCEKFASQANAAPAGSSSTDPRKFRSPRGKITPGARHHTLLVEANNLWRLAYRLDGINCFEEQDTIDQVWMWLAGANLLVCDPPKTEAEVQVIFKSSQAFMYKEILAEIDAKAVSAAEVVEPKENTESDTFGNWLFTHGIHMQMDKSMEVTDESPERVNEWVSNWRMEYLTKGDEELMAVHFEGFDKAVVMKPAEFTRSELFARRVQQDTHGQLCLDRTFPYWTWESIWKGRKNDAKGKNGMTRGLKEYLLSKAAVVENKSQDLSDQVEDLVMAMAGNLDAIKTGIEEYLDSALARVPDGRLKQDIRGSITTIRAPEDPMSGWYYHEDEILLLVKMDELNKKYRSSYGSGVANRLISEALTGEKLQFERRKFSKGTLAGRWFCKSHGKLTE